MVKQWSRKLWFVALCAVLCATLMAVEGESKPTEVDSSDQHSNGDSESGSQETGSQQSDKDSNKSDDGSSNQGPNNDSPREPQATDNSDDTNSKSKQPEDGSGDQDSNDSQSQSEGPNENEDTKNDSPSDTEETGNQQSDTVSQSQPQGPNNSDDTNSDSKKPGDDTSNHDSNSDSQSQSQGPNNNEGTNNGPGQDDSEEEEFSTHGHTDPDCIHHKNQNEAEHVYALCTLTCDGDEVIIVADNKTCKLPATLSPPVPLKSRASEAESLTGVCNEGQCTQKSPTKLEIPSPKEELPQGPSEDVPVAEE